MNKQKTLPPNESRAELLRNEEPSVTGEHIQMLPLNIFFPFANHPYQIRDDPEMAETLQSVSERGVLQPILARPRQQGGYEIISGHRRLRACELAGLKEIPAIIRDMDDEEAIIVMVDSNVQREYTLPSEKAFAYKMRLDAIRRKQGTRSDLTSATGLQKLDGKSSRELLADQSNESHEQIRRYIRLTYLVIWTWTSWRMLLPLVLRISSNHRICSSAIRNWGTSSGKEEVRILSRAFSVITAGVSHLPMTL